MSGDYQGIKIRLHEPGGFTEHLPDDLLPFLADCLEQVTEITDLAREDETVIWGPDEQLKQYLVREGTETKDGGVKWISRYENSLVP